VSTVGISCATVTPVQKEILSYISFPYGVAVDATGNVYVADTNNNAVKVIPAGGGAVQTLGSGFIQPGGVAVDRNGRLYVIDTNAAWVSEHSTGSASSGVVRLRR
jgi:DNA-binding beta-propeller fold protein YncE